MKKFTPQTPESQKKIVKTQDSRSSKTTPSRDHKTPSRGHRRMSSVGQGALLTDLMHVSVDQDDVEIPPGLERKVIGIHKNVQRFHVRNALCQEQAWSTREEMEG